jgi:hypothetical protein
VTSHREYRSACEYASHIRTGRHFFPKPVKSFPEKTPYNILLPGLSGSVLYVILYTSFGFEQIQG